MFGFFKKGLEKTKEAIREIIPTKQVTIDKELLEEILLEADVDYDTVETIITLLPNKNVKRDSLKKVLLSFFPEPKNIIFDDDTFVEIILGVNGAGKTTTIAKLANNYKKAGLNVVLGAADTFRAAAIEQLSIWADKLNIPIIKTQQGHDPSAVAYDAISSGVAKKMDVVLIDTAGRLHNQKNLANELKKIIKVSKKAYPNAPHSKVLILDGTQGNSAIDQAVAFDEIVGLTGLIITKLDGTAKGGSIFSIANSLKLPIKYIGVGEQADDLVVFEAEKFVDELLDGFYLEE